MIKSSILLIVQNNSFPFDKRVYKEAASLNNNDYKVFVISPMSRYDKKKRENIDGIEVYRYSDLISGGRSLGFLIEYLNSVIRIFFLSHFLLLKKRIKVVHVANPPDFFWPLGMYG